DAFHVEGRIGFGIAKRLGFGQYVIEGTALVAHFGENEVAGTVDDARHPLDAVGRQAFAQRLDDRNATGHRCLVGHHHALLPGSGEDLVAVHGDQCLVGGDHVLAVGNGFHDDLQRHVITTDQLDNDVDVRIACQRQRIVTYLDAVAHVAGGVRRAGSNMGHLDRPACPTGNLLGVALQNIEGATAYGAQTTYTHFDRFQTRNPTYLSVLDCFSASWMAVY